MLSTTLNASEVLEREFLPIRAKLLEIAAALDRMDRAEGSAGSDPRMERIRQAIEALELGSADRAEQVQMIFSLPYDATWKRQFGLQGSS